MRDIKKAAREEKEKLERALMNAQAELRKSNPEAMDTGGGQDRSASGGGNTPGASGSGFRPADLPPPPRESTVIIEEVPDPESKRSKADQINQAVAQLASGGQTVRIVNGGERGGFQPVQKE